MKLAIPTCAILVAPFVHAQQSDSYNTPIPCCSVPATDVPSSRRLDWCAANIGLCTNLCQSRIASGGNSCDSNSLQFECKCSNGTSLDAAALAPYQQSIPGQMCRFWFGACINATNGQAAQQFQCETARNEQCGNLSVRIAASSSLRPVSITETSTIGSPGSSTASVSSGTSSATSNGAEPKGSDVSGGAIAGTVVGGAAGISIVVASLWLCIRRRRRRTKNLEAAAAAREKMPWNEKQTPDAANMPLPLKPELSGDTAINELDAHSAAARELHGDFGAGGNLAGTGDASMQDVPPAELHSTPQHQSPIELYAPGNSSAGNDATSTAAQVPRQEAGTVYTQNSARVEDDQSIDETSQVETAPSPEPASQPRARDSSSASPESSRNVLTMQLSPEDVAALEEEERRIDAEIEEVRRVKELRDQKLAIQKKLREARRR